MFNHLLKLGLISALIGLGGISLTELRPNKMPTLVKRIVYINWKPISVFPEIRSKFRKAGGLK